MRKKWSDSEKARIALMALREEKNDQRDCSGNRGTSEHDFKVEKGTY